MSAIEKVDDGAIKRVGIKRFEDDAGDIAWLDPERDSAARRLKMGETARSPIWPVNATNGRRE